MDAKCADSAYCAAAAAFGLCGFSIFAPSRGRGFARYAQYSRYRPAVVGDPRHLRCEHDFGAFEDECVRCGKKAVRQ